MKQIQRFLKKFNIGIKRSCIAITMILLLSVSVLAQNPIVPSGVYIADPTARVWNDGKCQARIYVKFIEINMAAMVLLIRSINRKLFIMRIKG